MAGIYLSHTFWAGLMVLSVLASGQHPGVLFFAFLLNYLYRILTLGAIFAYPGRTGRPPGWVGPQWVRSVTRAPGPFDRNEPVREGSSTGPPAGFSAYLIVTVVCGVFGYVLVHSVNTHDFDVTFPQALKEMGAASWLGLIWWVQDLTGRSLVVDPGKGIVYNLGFNSRETGIAAVTVLTGGFLLVVGEGLGVGRNPWWIVGSLIFYRWLWGTWEDKQRLRGQGIGTDNGKGSGGIQ